MKKLREEGFQVRRCKVRSLMKTLSLVVAQPLAYKVTMKREHSNKVAPNLLNQGFNPVAKGEVWAVEETYPRIIEGWMYLAIVMDLYSRGIVGWHIDNRITTDLICNALVKMYNLMQPPKGLVFDSDRGSEYTNKRFEKLLKVYGIRASMSEVGACWDNAVV